MKTHLDEQLFIKSIFLETQDHHYNRLFIFTVGDVHVTSLHQEAENTKHPRLWKGSMVPIPLSPYTETATAVLEWSMNKSSWRRFDDSEFQLIDTDAELPPVWARPTIPLSLN